MKQEVVIKREHNDELEAWKLAFSDLYIDPYDHVYDIAEVL